MRHERKQVVGFSLAISIYVWSEANKLSTLIGRTESRPTGSARQAVIVYTDVTANVSVASAAGGGGGGGSTTVQPQLVAALWLTLFCMKCFMQKRVNHTQTPTQARTQPSGKPRGLVFFLVFFCSLFLFFFPELGTGWNSCRSDAGKPSRRRRHRHTVGEMKCCVQQPHKLFHFPFDSQGERI